MVLKKQIRHDPRREAARVALIECAEALVAERGVRGVSVRDITLASGSSNNGAVAYYFGTKAALIEAIYRHRLPSIEIRRAELLGVADRSGTCNEVVTLLRVLFQPLAEQTNDQGRHSYAGFLDSIAREGWVETRMEIGADFPTTMAIAERLRCLHQVNSAAPFDVRIQIVSGMITQGIGIMDHATQRGDDGLAACIFADVLAMAAKAMTATA